MEPEPLVEVGHLEADEEEGAIPMLNLLSMLIYFLIFSVLFYTWW
jgi:hypothetical protein